MRIESGSAGTAVLVMIPIAKEQPEPARANMPALRSAV
jgi:hypothetical protein